MSDRIGDWICTHSGLQFYPIDCLPHEIKIIDIAHALSNICRFTGHCRTFYSVAEHSVRVAEAVYVSFANVSTSDLELLETTLFALLHDATEAYLGDVSRPLKYSKAMEGYRQLESRLELIIREKFGLHGSYPIVKVYDDTLLVTECRDLMDFDSTWDRPFVPNHEPLPGIIIPWAPNVAKTAFLKMFNHLTDRIEKVKFAERGNS